MSNSNDNAVPNDFATMTLPIACLSYHQTVPPVEKFGSTVYDTVVKNGSCPSFTLSTHDLGKIEDNE